MSVLLSEYYGATNQTDKPCHFPYPSPTISNPLSQSSQCPLSNPFPLLTVAILRQRSQKQCNELYGIRKQSSGRAPQQKNSARNYTDLLHEKVIVCVGLSVRVIEFPVSSASSIGLHACSRFPGSYLLLGIRKDGQPLEAGKSTLCCCIKCPSAFHNLEIMKASAAHLAHLRKIHENIAR